MTEQEKIEMLLRPRYEIIKDAPKYRVSDHGWVENIKTGKQLMPGLNNRGYRYVELQCDGDQKRFYISRLVATYFVPNPDNLPIVNHKDGDKTNNFYENLEWGTHKHNIRHAFDTGLQKQGVKHYSSRFSEEDLYDIKELAAKNLRIFEIARIYNVSETAVNNLIKGRSYRNMTVNGFDLLRPRFKVTSNYPFSPYKIGTIITTGKNSTLFRMMEKFPTVFSPIQWWEERKPEEMPEFVKDKVYLNEYVLKVDIHFMGIFGTDSPPYPYILCEHRFIYNGNNSLDGYYRGFLPAAESEYLQYHAQKSKEQ